MQFDEARPNHCFAHTMVFAPAHVVGANLEIRLRAHGRHSTSSLANETLRLSFDGTGFEWGRSISELAGVPWVQGETATICVNLGRLPFGGGSILDSLASGELDILVGKNTMVDYVTLRIRTCQ